VSPTACCELHTQHAGHWLPAARSKGKLRSARGLTGLQFVERVGGTGTEGRLQGGQERLIGSNRNRMKEGRTQEKRDTNRGIRERKE
jgi:hypothetical protein